MLEPSAGELLINGRSAGDMGAARRYASLSCVFQEPARFHTFTVGDNVFLGDVDRERGEEEIGRALDFAGLGDVDRDADLGKDVGGTDLSGGQWQRIAISRAFMGDRPILLLDEPTSQLDPMAEADLYHEFAGMVENKTALFITHRLASTMITDRIFVIRDGKVAEEGTHEALMAAEGIYARMFQSQRQWYRHGGSPGSCGEEGTDYGEEE